MLSESGYIAHIFCERRILTLPKWVLPQTLPSTNRRAYCSLTPSLLPRLQAGYITATTNAYFTIYLRHSRVSEPLPTERAERTTSEALSNFDSTFSFSRAFMS